jgi:hypothetical protein
MFNPLDHCLFGVRAGVLNVQGLPALTAPGEGGQRLVVGWLVPLWLLTLWFAGYALSCVAQLMVKQERKRTLHMVSPLCWLCSVRCASLVHALSSYEAARLWPNCSVSTQLCF